MLLLAEVLLTYPLVNLGSHREALYDHNKPFVNKIGMFISQHLFTGLVFIRNADQATFFHSAIFRHVYIANNSAP